MYAQLLLPALAATFVYGQGEGLGYPPPAPVLLTTTKSGVLPVLPATPSPFPGVETLEGAIIQKGPPNASYTPVKGPAPVQSNQPAATIIANLPSTNFDNGTGSTVTGSVSISTTGTGGNVVVNIQGLPDFATYGPFQYHIHDLPVPADGNCTATLGHYDPQNAGEYFPCIVSAPQNCQVGDLTGKHGAITKSGTFSAAYNDPFLNVATLASKSIVIHTGNTTRITCANFALSSGSNSTATSTNGTQANSTAVSPPITGFTGGASVNVAGFVAVLAAGLAVFALL